MANSLSDPRDLFIPFFGKFAISWLGGSSGSGPVGGCPRL